MTDPDRHEVYFEFVAIGNVVKVTAIDSHTGTEIMNFIREFNQSLGMTIVMVTHERALAERYARRMILLADGKLIDDRPNDHD